MCDTTHATAHEAVLSAPQPSPGDTVGRIALQPVDEVRITV
ncbi:hypothetical protein [Streptomyces sp. NPDC005731]